MGSTDRVFVMMFVAVMVLILTSLAVSCVISFSSHDQKTINSLNECTLAVFKYGCACIVGLLAGRKGTQGK